MIVDFLDRIDITELMSFLWSIIGTVIKTVTLPRCARKFGPSNMVIKQFSGLDIHYIELLPVASAARDRVGCILAVV